MTPSPTPAASQQPLAGPQVIDAQLFAGARGYVRTARSLLWTDNRGASWQDITPPGLTEAQLRSAAVAVLPDGRGWIAVSDKAGSGVRLLRRSPASRGWTSTTISLATLAIAPDASASVSLSFSDSDDGWLLAGEQVTHTGAGELLRSTDGGATWIVQANQRSLPAIGTIHFLTPQLGYLDANGSMGTRGWWTTRDAGQSWTQLRLPTPTAKRSDAVNLISAPTVAGDAVVLAASFSTPTAGTADGVGIYRSTDDGISWTVQQLASATPADQYDFAVTPDGSSYLLLWSQPATDLQTFSWVTSHSSDGGHHFTDTTSVHNFYPGSLTLADPNHLWTVGGANGCQSFKTDCWNTAGLIASNDGGTSWHQLKLPS